MRIKNNDIYFSFFLNFLKLLIIFNLLFKYFNIFFNIFFIKIIFKKYIKIINVKFIKFENNDIDIEKNLNMKIFKKIIFIYYNFNKLLIFFFFLLYKKIYNIIKYIRRLNKNNK